MQSKLARAIKELALDIDLFKTSLMSSQVELDPYLAQAQNDDVTPAQKIEGLSDPPREVHASLIS